MPFGGKYQRTPIQAMVQKVSVEKKHTDLSRVHLEGGAGSAEKFGAF